MVMYYSVICFFFKPETAYEMRISDWSSDVCSSDLRRRGSLSDRVDRRDRNHPAWLRADHDRAPGDTPGPDALTAHSRTRRHHRGDRTRVVSGQSVTGRVEPEGRRII